MDKRTAKTSVTPVFHAAMVAICLIGATATYDASALAAPVDLSNTTNQRVTGGEITAQNGEHAVDAEGANKLTLVIDKTVEGADIPTVNARSLNNSDIDVLDTGSIKGTQEGIRFENSEIISVSNAGTIESTDSSAIIDGSNNSKNIEINNKNSISGKDDTILLQSSEGVSITNSETIKTTGGNNAVMLIKSDNGSVSNSGTIKTTDGSNTVNIGGTSDGTLIQSESMTVTNSGTIEADGNNGIRGTYAKNAVIENTATGSIKATEDAVDLGNSTGSTLINKGIIESSEDDGVDVDNAKKLTIHNTGIIRAGDEESSDMDDGIEADDVSETTITNDGTIVADNNGIDLGGAKDSVLRNSGTIRARNDDGIDLGSSESSVLRNSGTILAEDDDGIDADNVEKLTLYNTGIIQASDNDGIELVSASDSSVTNTGVIKADTEAIDASASDDLVIENSGSIEASANTIRLNKNSRLTNAGRITATDANADAIVVEGADNTVILEAGSRVIGDIETTGSNNTLRINVGGARSVIYETTGDWNLEFMDGRPGIEGSVVTAGIGQLETADELMHRQFADLRDSLKRLESTDDPTTNPIQVDAYRGREKRDAGKGHPTLEKYELRTTALTLALPVELLGIAQPFANYSENALDIDGNAHHIDVQSLRLGLRQPELFRHGALAIGGRVAIGRNFHNGDREVLVNTNGTNASERQTASWRSNIAELAVNANYHQALTSTLRLGISPEFAAQHHRIEGYRESEAFLWKKRSLTQGQAALALTLDYTAEPNTRLNLKARAWHRELLDGETADYRLNTTDVSYTDPMTSDQGLEVGVGMTQKPSDQITIQANLTGYRTKHHTDGAIGSLTLQRRF